MNQNEVSLRGVALTIIATAAFALISPYVKWLAPLDGVEIFAWRTLWTLPIVIVLMIRAGSIGKWVSLLNRLRKHPGTLSLLLACAGLLGLQQWLFMWAPLHGRMLDVSLGYFLLPIVMVLVSKLVDAKPIHALQWIAVACAGAGVAHKFLIDQAFSWPTLVVALGFPPYFLLRRKLRHDSLSILGAELMAMAPVAAIMALRGDNLSGALGSATLMGCLLPGLGILSALSFSAYLRASQLLPIGIFGLFGYIEPILLAIISAALFHEPISANDVWTYAPVSMSVFFTGLYVWQVRKPSITEICESLEG
ncbi:EamA family transporter RarD [Paraburkholderia sp. J94]|uniref:EamA family transporter RarD n=1 Tax=Paraburkholderia sp. J94 TaxID=2805441 RepID=UPI002AB2FF71|nr:EamA family transporter RarD [Paraburkholderia sp. J94]